MENQYLDTNIDQEVIPNAGYGSFLRRFAAVMIDGVIFTVIMGILFAATGGVAKLTSMVEDGSFSQKTLYSSFLVPFIALYVLQWLYFAYFESSDKQGTLGKQAMGLFVTDINGDRLSFQKASIRYFARLLPGLIPVIGALYSLADYLSQPFTEKKQTLHDMIAGSLVFKR